MLRFAIPIGAVAALIAVFVVLGMTDGTRHVEGASVRQETVKKPTETVAVQVPTCPFDRLELDLSRGPDNPVDSPFNRAIAAIHNGRRPDKIQSR